MKKVLLLLGMLVMSFLGFTQVSKQNAVEIVMDSIVGSDSTNVNVYMEPLLQSNTYYVTSPFDSIQSPYASYWLFFIDDMPSYMWCHACRYVFVDAANGSLLSVSKQKPPTHWPSTYEVISNTDEILSAPNYGNNYHVVTPVADVNNGKYAVLFCCDNSSYWVFWNAISHMYCALVEQGYPKENIYVLSHNGTTNTNPMMDLDGDNIPDIMNRPCDSANLCAIFDSLSIKMKEGDILYVMSLSHGEHYPTGAKNLLLWGEEGWGYPFTITSYAGLLSRLKCSEIIVNIHACYAGAFVEDLVNAFPSGTKYSVLACTGDNQYMIQPSFENSNGMPSYPFLCCSALRGSYPIPSEPWIAGANIGHHPNFPFTKPEQNYDETWGNNNGLHEIDELIKFCSFDVQFDSLRAVNNYNCGFIEDLLSLRGITGNVTNSQTVSGSFHVEDNFRLTNNAALELDADSKLFLFDANLYVNEGSTLTLGDRTSIIARSGSCHVYVSGDIEFGDDVSFIAEDGSTLEVSFLNTTSQQIVDAVRFTNCSVSSSSASDIVLRNCLFSNCQVNPTGDVSANYCSFTESSLVANTPSYVVSKTALVSNCSINNLNHVGVSLTNYMNYEVSNNSITANNYPGIYVFMCGRYVLATSLISNNTVTGCSSGIQAYSSRGTVFDNEISGNGIGMRFDNISNMSVYGSTTGNGQRINDNIGIEVYVSGNSFPSRFEYNRIVDEDNLGNPTDPLLLYGTGAIDAAPTVFDIEHNYWGTCFNPSEDLNPYGLFDYDPVWDGRSANSPERQLYQDAETSLMAGRHDEADSLYRLVISTYPNSSYAQAAMKQLLYAENLLQNGYDNLKDYYGQITDTTLLALADNLYNKCDEMLENWLNAISWYENILINPASYEDSVYAVIDLGNLYLEMDSTRGFMGRMPQYRPVSRIGHDENTKLLLEALPRRDAPMTIVKRNHPTVANLSTEIMENNEVLLTWNYPEGNLSEMTLSWSNMDMVDCFGFQAAQCATDQVQRFDTMDLRILDGWKIEDVTVILSPYDSVLISPYDTTYPPLGNYFIRIWKGDDTDLTMVYEQLIENPVFGRPLTVTLDSDVLVDANSELRVGYYLDQYTRYTWAFDSQSSTYEGKSALIQVYSNQSECNPNYWHFNHYYNLCISSTLTNPNGQGVAEGLTGYRVYRNGDLIATIPFAFQTYYIDAELTRNFDVEYCITAVYGDEESEPVCATVGITGIGEKLENDYVVTLSPNPTNGIVYIDGMVASEIRVYNALGQLVKAFNDTNEIDLKDLTQGVYLLRITDGNGAIATKKVMVE